MSFPLLPSRDWQRLLTQAEETGLSPIARERLEWIVHFAQHGRSLTETCAFFQVGRGTLHRWIGRFDPENLSSLEDRPHDPQHVRQPAVAPEVVEAVRAYRQRDPHLGKESIARLLQAEHGVSVSGSTVGRVIEREGLYFGSTPLHWKKRLQRQHEAEAPQEDAPSAAQPTQPQPPPSPLPSAPACGHAGCLSCRLKRWNWRPVRRALVTASLLANLVLLTAFVSIACWERARAQEQSTIQAQLAVPGPASSSALRQ